MPSRLRSYTLVAIQFVVLAAIALTGPWFATGFWLLLEVAAIGLGLWAIVAMRVGNFNITPDPKQDAVLVKSGPYRWVRHPMYSALILLSIAFIASHFSWLRLLLLLILTIDLVVKLNYEEQMLQHRFDEYNNFRQQTWRLVPFLY